MTRFLRFTFTLSTLLLVLGGAVMVGAQVVALVVGRGDWLEQVPEVVGPPTLFSASAAGLLAFLLSYVKQQPVADDESSPGSTGENSEGRNGASQTA